MRVLGVPGDTMHNSGAAIRASDGDVKGEPAENGRYLAQELVPPGAGRVDRSTEAVFGAASHQRLEGGRPKVPEAVRKRIEARLAYPWRESEGEDSLVMDTDDLMKSRGTTANRANCLLRTGFLPYLRDLSHYLPDQAPDREPPSRAGGGGATATGWRDRLSVKWQAAKWPPPRSREAGTSTRQRASAYRQRGWNGQPAGGSTGLGASPSRRMRGAR